MITFVKTKYPKEGDTIYKNFSPNRNWEILQMKFKDTTEDKECNTKTNTYNIKLKKKGLNYTLPWMLMNIENGPYGGNISLYFCGNRLLLTKAPTQESLFETLDRQKKKLLAPLIKNDCKMTPQKRIALLTKLKEYSK